MQHVDRLGVRRLCLNEVVWLHRLSKISLAALTLPYIPTPGSSLSGCRLQALDPTGVLAYRLIRLPAQQQAASAGGAAPDARKGTAGGSAASTPPDRCLLALVGPDKEHFDTVGGHAGATCGTANPPALLHGNVLGVQPQHPICAVMGSMV